MKVSIVIPVYNEVRTISELLGKVYAQPLPYEKEIVIVESGSKDGTRELVEAFAQAHAGVTLVLQDVPKGKGYAVREGFTHASGDIILIQDGDLEYDVKDYPALLAPIAEGKAAFVLGSRHLSKGWNIRKFTDDPLKAYFMNLGGALFHGFFNVLYGTNLSDPTTMYKVFRRECLEKVSFSANRFDFDFELLGKLIRAGYRPIEVPVSYHSRGFSEGKKVRIFRDPPLWVLAIIKTRFAPLKKI
jgi:glycosyltransferase involved in cell wall biosynthesis